MARISRTLWVLKWSGTPLCVLIAFAFVYSTRRNLTWTSRNLDQASLILGTVTFGRIHDDAPLDNWQYTPSPGWSQADYGGDPKLWWWVESGKNRYWHWIQIPLWMPFVVLALPTTILWYQDRRSVPDAIRRLSVWLTPQRPARVSVWLVIVFCILHLVSVLGVLMAYEALSLWLNRVIVCALDQVVLALLPVLGWGTPMFGYLWARGFTSYRNRLFRLRCGYLCQGCGYDLTGNESGVCPECGVNVTGNRE